jgi:hypothetical protein
MDASTNTPMSAKQVAARKVEDAKKAYEKRRAASKQWLNTDSDGLAFISSLGAFSFSCRQGAADGLQASAKILASDNNRNRKGKIKAQKAIIEK